MSGQLENTNVNDSSEHFKGFQNVFSDSDLGEVNIMTLEEVNL